MQILYIFFHSMCLSAGCCPNHFNGEWDDYVQIRLRPTGLKGSTFKCSHVKWKQKLRVCYTNARQTESNTHLHCNPTFCSLPSSRLPLGQPHRSALVCSAEDRWFLDLCQVSDHRGSEIVIWCYLLSDADVKMEIPVIVQSSNSNILG